MGRYILRRLIIAIPVLIGVSLAIFVIMRIAPGDVATMLLAGSGENAVDPKEAAALRETLGLDKSYPQQYFEFVSGIVRLDPGDSLWTGKPVMTVLRERVGVTIELALLALIVALVIAVPTGVLSAVYQDTRVDYVFRVVSVAGLAIPVFWMGTLVILALWLWFSWAPPMRYTNFVDDPWRNLQQLIWPALVLGYSSAAIMSRMTRSAMLEVLREDYVRTASAKGLRNSAVIFRHAFRNAVLPVLTLASIQFGHLIGGAVITETIFSLPGVGRFLVDAIIHRDYPVVQTLIVLFAVIFVMLNLLVDVLYGLLDPRIRYA